jgi:serine/threonine protein kinase
MPRYPGRIKETVDSKRTGSTTAGSPARIGRYELLSELFRSEVGSVWAAKATGGGEETTVLVRRILKRPPVSEQAFQTITEAAFSMVDVRDPRIAAVTDVVVTATEIAIVSEHTPGQLLLKVQQTAKLKQAPLPVSAALRLVVDLLDALVASEPLFREADVGEELLHGGFAPDFAWVTSDGAALLLDLPVGLAIAADEKLARLPHFLAYRAPEQLAGPADARADVFAVGVLFWELLANRSQIPGTARPDPRRTPKPIVRLDSLTRSDGVVISTPLADLVARAVDADPAKRFQSPQEMTDAIQGLESDRVASLEDVKTSIERLSLAPAATKGSTPAGPAAPGPLPAPKVPPKPAAVPVEQPPPEPVPEPAAAPAPDEGPKPSSPAPTSITALFDDLELPAEPGADEAPSIAAVPRFDTAEVADLLSSPAMQALNASAHPAATPRHKRGRLVIVVAVAAVVVSAVALLAIMLLAPDTTAGRQLSSNRNLFARFQIFRRPPVDAGASDAGANSDAHRAEGGDRSLDNVPTPRPAPAQPEDQGAPGDHEKTPAKKKPFMPTAI